MFNADLSPINLGFKDHQTYQDVPTASKALHAGILTPLPPLAP